MDYFLGIIISFIVEFIKKYFGTTRFGTLLALFIISFLGAGIYTFLSIQDYWTGVMKIIITASAFHNLIIRRMEEK